MELEALAGELEAAPLPWRVTTDATGWVMDPLPMLDALRAGARRGESVESLAAAFHETVAGATLDVVEHVRRLTHCDTVALGGGCFQNARLLRALQRRLAARGFEVLVPRHLSPNDGAVSLGQAVVAAAQLAGVKSRVLLPEVSSNGGG